MASDFTHVATWNGFVYVAFVIDAYARRIVGWRVARSAEARFVLDALGQAIHARRPVEGGGLIHHSDRGSQYLSIRYSERLGEAGIAPSVGSVGDSCDNALAETVIGLFKTGVIRRAGPGRSLEAVEFATLEWVDWFNHRRLLEPIGNIPPAEAEAKHYAKLEAHAVAAQDSKQPASGKPGAVQLTYIGKYRDGLGRFLTDGRVEIDNNTVERAIRPIAPNRKNALFAGHDAGAENWAVIASFIETCKMNNLDPHAWLSATLTAIVQGHKQSHINDLLPWNYAVTV